MHSRAARRRVRQRGRPPRGCGATAGPLQLGGFFLSSRRAFPEAIAIHRKGIGHDPDCWELPSDLGHLYAQTDRVETPMGLGTRIYIGTTNTWVRQSARKEIDQSQKQRLAR